MADIQRGAGEVTGNVAHDAVDAGNPIKLGGRALSFGGGVSVAANDRTDLRMTRQGVPWVGWIDDPFPILSFRTYTSAQSGTILVFTNSGFKIFLSSITVTIDNACTVPVSFQVYTAPGGADNFALRHPGLAPGGICQVGNRKGIIFIGPTSEFLLFSCSAPTGGSLNLKFTWNE